MRRQRGRAAVAAVRGAQPTHLPAPLPGAPRAPLKAAPAAPRVRRVLRLTGLLTRPQRRALPVLQRTPGAEERPAGSPAVPPLGAASLHLPSRRAPSFRSDAFVHKRRPAGSACCSTRPTRRRSRSAWPSRLATTSSWRTSSGKRLRRAPVAGRRCGLVGLGGADTPSRPPRPLAGRLPEPVRARRVPRPRPPRGVPGVVSLAGGHLRAARRRAGPLLAPPADAFCAPCPPQTEHHLRASQDVRRLVHAGAAVLPDGHG